MSCLAKLLKSSRENVCIAFDEFSGHDLINMCGRFLAKETEMRPRRNGSSIRADQFPDLLEMLRSVAEPRFELSAVSIHSETQGEIELPKQTG